MFSPLSHKQACNVLYLNSVETECLTGPEAVSKATKCTLSQNPRPAATVVHFKVSSQGITLTDNKRRYDAGHLPAAATAVFPGIIFNQAELNRRGLEDRISQCANAFRLFFRRHYPISSVTFSSLDPQDQRSVRVPSKLNVPLLLITISLALVRPCIFLDFKYYLKVFCLHACFRSVQRLMAMVACLKETPSMTSLLWFLLSLCLLSVHPCFRWISSDSTPSK